MQTKTRHAHNARFWEPVMAAFVLSTVFASCSSPDGPELSSSETNSGEAVEVSHHGLRACSDFPAKFGMPSLLRPTPTDSLAIIQYAAKTGQIRTEKPWQFKHLYHLNWRIQNRVDTLWYDSLMSASRDSLHFKSLDWYMLYSLVKSDAVVVGTITESFDEPDTNNCYYFAGNHSLKVEKVLHTYYPEVRVGTEVLLKDLQGVSACGRNGELMETALSHWDHFEPGRSGLFILAHENYCSKLRLQVLNKKNSGPTYHDQYCPSATMSMLFLDPTDPLEAATMGDIQDFFHNHSFSRP